MGITDTVRAKLVALSCTDDAILERDGLIFSVKSLEIMWSARDWSEIEEGTVGAAPALLARSKTGALSPVVLQTRTPRRPL